MKRVFMTISYDGTAYVGWQKQPNGMAVEEVINKHLSALLGEDIQVIGASRTDSGVHASGNVAVFDTETRIPADKICFALNQRLPEDIVIQESHEVSLDFHPRHANCSKTYEYTIFNAVHPDPLIKRYSYFIYAPLNVDAMREAAVYLVGEHDFASFCSAGGQQKTTVRTIYGIDIEVNPKMSDAYVAAFGKSDEPQSDEVQPDKTQLDGAQLDKPQLDKLAGKRQGAGKITIRISGNGFLYNMVRIIVGTLVRVGHGIYTPEHVKEILEACDRNTSGPKVPAQGLKLVGIRYENE